VQDLVLSAAGALNDVGSRTRRALDAGRSIERVVASAADLVVSCSPGFRDYFVSLGVSPAKVETVLNWAAIDEFDAAPPSQNGHKPAFLYAGNVGYTQGFETLLDAARLSADALVVKIVGAGNARQRVIASARELPNVEVAPPVEDAAVPAMHSSADATIVLQRRVAAGANLPSKIATYLASGRPIVASIEDHTPAAKILRESGGAILVEPESPHLLADAMRTLARDRELRVRLGRNGRAYAERRLAKQPTLERFEAAILG
jgi:glycosyltransferase involved in cell wall biosynthesis